MTRLFMAWSVPDHKTRDHLITGMIRYGITRFHFCQNPTLLRGVICRVKGVLCREKGVICRNWETTHFPISKFEAFQVWYGWQTMGAHNAHCQIERSGSNFYDTGTMAPTSPVFGFIGFLVLSSFALFHTILATCSSHTGMSCRLFSRWFGASSRHQQYPTVVGLESQLGIELLGYDFGMIFQGHFSCSRKLPGIFLILRGWNFALFAKRPIF